MNGKNILIVGASSGIGHALAKQLQMQGATLFTAGRQEPQGITSTHMTWDVTQSTAADALNQLPTVLHGLVYCPGTINLKPFQRLTIEDYHRDLEIYIQPLGRYFMECKGSLTSMVSLQGIRSTLITIGRSSALLCL